MSSPTVERKKVAFLFSHKDVKWLERIRVHLMPLEREGVVETWDDTRIKPGSDWRGEIRKALDSAKVIVLLISADFLASDFIEHDELPPLLTASQEEGALILPLIISPSRFTRVAGLAQFQSVNSPDRPLNRLSKPDQEGLFVRLTKVIEDAVVRQVPSQEQDYDKHAHLPLTAGAFEEIMRQFAQLNKKIETLQNQQNRSMPDNRKVFIVHGHDHAAMETVARFLTQIGFEPVILHEQPSEGRAVIEKFEFNAQVAYAVVLLTPDDKGHALINADEVKLRARQNVIFELGFFISRLGRSRVCALCKGSVEIPSDYHGVIYVNMDDGQGWKMVLAKEMKRAGLDVDLNRML